MHLRVGTFNVENLFARYRFRDDVSTRDAIRRGWRSDATRFAPFDPAHAPIIAAAIESVDADILGLQEVESLDTLKRFVREFLPGAGYDYAMLIDGNDERRIDVALLSRFPLGCLRTHQFDRAPNGPPLFPRDCLEAEIQLPDGRPFTIFVNHFKSMGGGRDDTMDKRQRQAHRVAQIVAARFDGRPESGDWIVVGDLNDFPPSPGLAPLLEAPWLENIVLRLPAGERWTHHFAHGDEYHLLDYILVSQKLARANPDRRPTIERRGLPERADRFVGPRFAGVGWDRPKASDHCPVVWEFEV